MEDAAFGTSLVFMPAAAGGLARALANVDVLVDETFYAGAPALANITDSLGFESVAAAREGVPAIAKGAIFRCGSVEGAPALRLEP